MVQYMVKMSRETKAELAFLSRYYDTPMVRIASDLLAKGIHEEFQHVLGELVDKEVLSEDEVQVIAEDVLKAATG